MTVAEYLICKAAIVRCRSDLRLVRRLMSDFAPKEQARAWSALESLWQALWQGFDDTHPDEDANPFTSDFWEYP